MTSVLCRACLAGDTKVYPLENYILEIYEKLTDAKLSALGPQTVCYVCHSLLQKCHRFSEMAQTSENSLQDLLDRGIEVSLENIRNPTLKSKLTTSRTQSRTDSDSTDCYVNEEINTIEEVVTKKEFTDEVEFVDVIDVVMKEENAVESIVDVGQPADDCPAAECPLSESTDRTIYKHNKTHSKPGADDNSTKNVEPVQQQATMNFSSEHSNTMITNQNLILNKINLLIENQKGFEQKLTSLSVKLDETNESIKQIQPGQAQQTIGTLKDASSEERETFNLKPIETNKEFEMFELRLSRKTYREKLITYLSTLYSHKPGEGQTCAYKLMDLLFTKEFLCLCSWSGGSKGEFPKIPMKKFMNFRKFLFQVVHMWDPIFTDDQMTRFFKVLLKNATQRRASQGLRDSTKRVRRSNKSRGEVGSNLV